MAAASQGVTRGHLIWIADASTARNLKGGARPHHQRPSRFADCRDVRRRNDLLVRRTILPFR
jgi:hypothetical protein